MYTGVLWKCSPLAGCPVSGYYGTWGGGGVYRGRAYRPGPPQISITKRCQSKAVAAAAVVMVGGSVPLAAAFTLSSEASWQEIWNVSIDIPTAFVASVSLPGSASHNKLFTWIQHWQWCHRMTKSVYALCQVCVQTCFFFCVCVLLVCMPVCDFLRVCVCWSL